jgi:hypothetical protein
MKKIMILFFALVLASCDWVKKVDKQMDADSTDIANEIADMTSTLSVIERLANEGELLFKAVGSEPGWYAEFHTNKFRMLMNYGKDSIVLFREFKQDGNFDFNYSISENGKDIKMEVDVEDKECTDAAGGKNPNVVTVKFNDKVFTGCGMPVKK